MDRSQEDAVHAAEKLLEASARTDGIARKIIGEPVDTGAHWVFFYQGRDYLENDDLDAMLVGNAPIVVPKDGSDSFALSTAEDLDAQIARLRDRNP
ncbi:YrhB domain-containing protein [Microbacterium sp. BWT-B31]|uniref:YrhB domain-containing protein n=1 Tax=Microbacterium sp. BWT-B31 TaxID=3232072 RepID=UPI0035288B70